MKRNAESYRIYSFLIVVACFLCVPACACVVRQEPQTCRGGEENSLYISTSSALSDSADLKMHDREFSLLPDHSGFIRKMFSG